MRVKVEHRPKKRYKKVKGEVKSLSHNKIAKILALLVALGARHRVDGAS